MGVNGDNEIVGCGRPPDVSSGTDGASEDEDDSTDETDGPAGELRTLD